MSNFYQQTANTWDYNSSLDGLTRVGSSGTRSLIWGYPVIDSARTKFLYKSAKNYQFQISIDSMTDDSTSLIFYGPFSTFFPFPGTSGRPNLIMEEPINQTTEYTYYCYGRPQFDFESTTGGQFDATLAFSASALTNFKTVEFDYFINGYKFKTISNSDTTCDGWVYNFDTDSFFYSFNNCVYPYSITGATVSSENFIARYIDFDNFNLILNVTYNSGSSGDGLDVYLTETDPTSFSYNSLVKQKIYNMPYTTNGIQSYNLSGLTGSQYFLINASASSGFEFTISDIKIQGGYHPVNNQTVSILNPLQIDNQDSSLGFSYSTIDSSGNAQYLNSKFGNGKFSKGIWKNGIWNSGWRNDNYSADLDDIVIAIKDTNLNNYEISQIWKIQIKGDIDEVNKFSIGDYISIGNIIATDLNSNRKLLKNYYRILDIQSNVIYLNIDVNFPILNIEKDSSLHKIKITKNIWLNGLFLNGNFSGVWNNGIFKGFPTLTLMTQSQWIDGVFDGGHFFSDEKVTADGSISTGLIQNFVFNDNNKSLRTNANTEKTQDIFQFYSWIDVNYKKISGVNIGKDISTWNDVYATEFTENNLFGYPTNDVLSSVSKFRDSYSTASRSYALGVKWKIYQDFIGDASTFQKPFGVGFGAGSSGYSNFINDGWTYSSSIAYTEASPIDAGLTLTFSAGVSTYSTTYLQNISGGSGQITGQELQVKSQGNGSILNNENIDIEKGRYSIVEFDLIDQKATTDIYSEQEISILEYPLIHFGNINIGNHIVDIPTGFDVGILTALQAKSISQGLDGTQIFDKGYFKYLPEYENIYYNRITDKTKREYFFNKKQLQMFFLGNGLDGSSPSTFVVDNIKLYEVDMIPFFKYFGKSNINKGVVIPYQGTSPNFNDDDKFNVYDTSNYSWVPDLKRLF